MNSEHISDRFDPNDGPVYRSDTSSDLFVVVDNPGPAAGDNDQVEIRRVEDGEWYGVFYDNFQRGYAKVADTLAEAVENGDIDD